MHGIKMETKIKWIQYGNRAYGKQTEKRWLYFCMWCLSCVVDQKDLPK